MIVLGINDGHDSGVCLLRDGRVVLCSSEERRLNSKNHAGVPEHSIVAVFKRSGIDPREVDLVTLSSRIRTTVPTRGHKPIYSVLNTLSSLARTDWGTALGRWLLPKLRKRHDLLRCLASAPRRTFTKEELARAVWGSELAARNSRTLDSHVARVRRKLTDLGAGEQVQTVRGVGIRLEQ